MERSEKRVELMEAELEWEEVACSHFIPIGTYHFIGSETMYHYCICFIYNDV